jgi:dynein light intermediate chain 1, cytosolic
MPNFLPLLVQYSLGIHSILKRQPLKHNVIDRDKILIPPNWDSWGKIRVLRDGFDVEGTSERWSVEIQPPADYQTEDKNASGSSLITVYEEMIKNPTSVTRSELDQPVNDLDVKTIAMQEFLSKQIEAIERLKAEEEEEVAKNPSKAGTNFSTDVSTESNLTIDESSRVKEHVGPIQFNMGGIQVDAEDMLNRIKERSGRQERLDSPEKEKELNLPSISSEEGKPKQEALANFFAGLIKKSGGSVPGTPPRDRTRPS